MDALGIDGPRLIFQVVNFLILLFLLQRLLFKPILRLMDSRATKIRESIDEADRMRRFAEETRKQTEAMLEDARKQANDILEGARHMVEQYEASEKERARKEADLLIERARDEIRLERDRAVAEVHRLAVNLAIDAAGKVIEQKLNPADHVKLVEDFLARAEVGGDGQH